MKTTMLHKKTKALGAWIARTVCIAGMLLAAHTVANAQFYLVEDFSTAETGFYYDGFPVTNTSTEYGFNWWFNPGQSLVFARGAVQTNDPDKDLIAAGNTYLLDLPGSLMINNQIKPYPAKLDLLNEQNGFPIVPTGYKSVSVTIAGSKIAASDIDWDTWNTVINPYTDPTVDETITYLNPKLDPFDGSKNGYTIQFTSKSNPTVESPEYTDQGIWHTYTFDVNSAGYTPQSIVFQGKTRGTFDYTDNVPWSGSHDVTQGFFSTPIIIGKIIFEYETKPSWASTTSLPQTISFDKLSGAVGETVTATTTAAGHTVSYIVADQSIAKADGNGTLKLLKLGTTKVTAYVAGDAAYDAAVDTVTINVTAKSKTPQTITGLTDITAKVGDADFDLTATASSNLAVTYTIADPTIATVTNGKVHILKEGTTTITAAQAGDDTYSAAPNVTVNLTVYNYSWLLAPTISIEGTNAKVVGTDADKFTKFYINGSAATVTNGVVDLSTKTGVLILKATTDDGTGEIKLTINKSATGTPVVVNLGINK
jgi:hypothetical protein